MGCQESTMHRSSTGKLLNSDYEFEIYAAIVKGNTHKISLLISQGFDINHRMSRFIGRSCLHIAAETGQLRCFQLLLDLGANINQKDNQGLVPIFLAASQGHLTIVEQCLRKGANYKYETNSGLVFQDFILKSHEKEFRDLLIRYNLGKLIKKRNTEPVKTVKRNY